MRVVRLLVYEGSPEWVEKSLAKRYVVGQMAGREGNYITEYYITSPIGLNPPILTGENDARNSAKTEAKPEVNGSVTSNENGNDRR